jgi:hypothetical protein
MADNVKVMSRNEALEAENATLKAERSKLKRQVARERYHLREEKKLHEHVHSSLVEGRVAADEITAAEARQLSETIKTTNDALEEARKSLKELEDRLASTHTVPGRFINFDNPSRWTIGKDVDNLAQFFTACFGVDKTKRIATEEEGAESTVNEGKAAHPSTLLGTFFKKHLPRLEVKRLLPPGALRKIEKGIADCITEHFDEISVDLFLHTKVNTRGYQTILNLLSSKHGAEGLVRAVLPYGTKFPKLSSTGVLRRRLAQQREELGVDTRVHQAAMSNAKKILTTRIHWLVANKKDFTIPGTDDKVLIQLLGDACGIFKKKKVHGTSIVLKTIYNTSGPEEASTVDEILHQCGVNSVENCTLLGFFGETTSTSTSRRSSRC